MANILYRGSTPSAANTSTGGVNRPLTNDEIDKNFYALNASKIESESDTLASVTARGSSTNTNLTLSGNNTLGNTSSSVTTIKGKIKGLANAVFDIYGGDIDGLSGSTTTLSGGNRTGYSSAADSAGDLVLKGGNVTSGDGYNNGGSVFIYGGDITGHQLGTSGGTLDEAGGDIHIVSGTTEFTTTAEKGSGNIYMDIANIGANGTRIFGQIYIGTGSAYKLGAGPYFSTTINVGAPTGLMKVECPSIYNKSLLINTGSDIQFRDQLSGPGATSVFSLKYYNGNLAITKFPFGGGTVSYPFTFSTDNSFTVTGAIYAGGDVVSYYTSDETLKTNIVRIDSALAKVNSLDGITFNWNEQAQEKFQKDVNVREAGVKAQQVKAVFPEVVKTREDGTLAVNYEQMVPLLIEAIKELTSQVKDLQSQLNNK